MLSINSSIEAAHLGNAGVGFQVIAKEIQQFAESNKKANLVSKANLSEVRNEINDVVGIRTADVAFDLIDKIDRNLFERNCDVQAWATFEAVVDYAKNRTDELKSKVTSLLFNLYQIYEVYYDILLTDEAGMIIASAVRNETVGMDASQTEWFLGAKKCRDCYVQDMHFSKLINEYVVSYSCKVVDENGKFLGVLTTRFNWNYIYDIIDKAKISSRGKVYVVNKSGLIIASKNREDILKRDIMDTCPIAKDVLTTEDYGYATELNAQNELSSVVGYAHTKGYNNYKGKEWSTIVIEIIS